MFGAFVVKKWHFPPESPEFRRKVAEFRPEFPEFRFLNLNSPSVSKMRFLAEFRPEFRFRWSPGFVKKWKGEPWWVGAGGDGSSQSASGQRARSGPIYLLDEFKATGWRLSSARRATPSAPVFGSGWPVHIAITPLLLLFAGQVATVSGWQADDEVDCRAGTLAWFTVRFK